jgi:hypothetical protein
MHYRPLFEINIYVNHISTIFGPERWEVIGIWRKLNNEKLQNYSKTVIFWNVMSSNLTGV